MFTALALHAYPDDESSKGAGTMARLADSGVTCVLVCATGGEAGDVLNPAMRLPGVEENLAEHRRAELDAAAKIIGYDEVIRLGYRDSGMPETADNRHPNAFVAGPFQDVLGEVVAIVRRIRPDVIFGYDEHARYPHPDHLRVHELTMALGGAAADASLSAADSAAWSVPLVLAHRFTARRALTLHTAMEARGLDSPLAGRLESLPSDEEHAAMVSVDVGTYIGRARRALRAHATQVDPQGPWFAIPEEVEVAAYPYEDFTVVFGGLDPDGTGPMGGLFEVWKSAN